MVEQTKLRHAMTWAQWQYAQAPHQNRPQWSERPEDQAKLVALVQATSKAYHQAKSKQKKVVFQTCCEQVLEIQCPELEVPERNFYKSVLAYYFNWRAHPKQYSRLLPSINKVEMFRRHIKTKYTEKSASEPEA